MTRRAPIRISRRQVLGAAAGGAVGAAALSAAAVRLGPSAGSAASAAGPSGAWASPLGTPRGLAAHLLRRAGFGADEAGLDAAASLRYEDLVDHVVSQAPQDPAAPPERPTDYRSVGAWWYRHMATTAAPFPERMALFWHGVLTSDFRKSNQLPFVYQQNRLFRSRGLGDLRTLLVETAHDPAMIRYLDLDRSTARSPNENFSRELMELFTLGVGNYTEQDVREGARAFSGLRIVLLDASGTRMALPRRQGMTAAEYAAGIDRLVRDGATFSGRQVPAQHDAGVKTFLGHGGRMGPEDAVDAILAQPACAVHVSTLALRAFCSPDPSPGLVASVADRFRRSRYDIRTLMRAIFTSDDFRADAGYRSLVRSPADYMVAAMRALDRPDLSARCMTAGVAMGQVLYDPPTVAGWPSGGGWLSSSALLARLNFAAAVVQGVSPLPDPAAAVRTHLDGVVGPDTAAVLAAARTPADRWYAILAGPEFHLE